MSNTKDHKSKNTKRKRPKFDKTALLEMIAQNNTEPRMYTTIHASELFDLLTQFGFVVEINPDAGSDALFLHSAGDSHGVLLASIDDNTQYQGDFAIGFQVRIAHHAMTYQSCNAWNTRWVFGKCYINDNNELTIQADLLLEGGVSGLAIARFVVEYLDLYDDLMQFDDTLG
jgi:hypothetical protein